MKFIEINSAGKYAGKYFVKVDDEDYDYLSKYKWHIKANGSKTYAIGPVSLSRITGESSMHRILMKHLLSGKLMVDHIDGDGLNNQKTNLRIATRSQNMANRNSTPNSSSKYLGVSWDNSRVKKKWRAQITFNGERTYIGNYATEEEAALAYNEVAKKYHGNFSNPNKI